MPEPLPYTRRYRVINERAVDYGRVGVLVDVLSIEDDPDFRERRFVLRFDGWQDVAFSQDEIEQVYVY